MSGLGRAAVRHTSGMRRFAGCIAVTLAVGFTLAGCSSRGGTPGAKHAPTTPSAPTSSKLPKPDGLDKPDAAWAVSVCTQDLQRESGDKGWWTTGPLGFSLIDGRAVTMAEAKDLDPQGLRHGLPTDRGRSRFAASCKIRYAHPELAHMKKDAQPALLAFDGGGSNLFIDDQYWARH